MSSTSRHMLREGLRAAVPAALVSGLPSTVHAVLAGRDPLEPSVAAGSILAPREQRSLPLLAAAVPVHLALSAGWAVVLAGVLPRKRPLLEGTLAGLTIAAIDLGLVGRRYPRIRALQTMPQVADHVAFGIVTALALTRQGGAAPGPWIR